MSIYDKYFLCTVLTIIIIRIFVYKYPKPSPTIKNFRIHHWMYGLFFTLLLLFTSNYYNNIYLLAISMGIFLDEIGFIIMRGKSHEDNYSPKSFIILMVFILLLFIFRESILNIYLK